MNRQLLDVIAAELAKENGCMLATVLSRRGSAPRGIGTSMVVSATESQSGTVGGGFLEHRAKQDALNFLEKQEVAIRAYDIHADEKNVYSGGVTILFRAFAGEAGHKLIAKMEDAFAQKDETYLVCQIENGIPLESSVLSEKELMETCKIECPPEQPLLTEGEPAWLIEPLRELPRVILFGGGHVAQCMARQLDLLDYRVWVVEDREAFSKEELFPSADRILHCDYATIEPLLDLNSRDHAIVMSRGHETDYQILRWLLRSNADYIGCIGSRKKIALTKERLRVDGLDETRIERLHAPIGLAIGAQTPAEIAVSVAGELIQYGSCKV